MDDRLRLIQYLYDDEVDDPAFARRLTEDEALYREYERLRATKEDLDGRPSPQPDPAVVDEVVETARTAAQTSPSPTAPTDDRPARAPTQTWTRRLQTASATLALVLLVGLAWWQAVPDTAEEAGAMSARETAQGTPPTVAESRSPQSRAMPAWDDSDELVRIHRRIERLQAHSGPDSWGTLQPASRSRP